MKRSLAAAAALTLSLTMSACTGSGDVADSSTSTSTQSAPAEGSGPAGGTTETPGTGSSAAAEPSGSQDGASPDGAGEKTPETRQQDGTVERLTDKGGVVTKGSEVTFVYNNGLRYQVDVGQDVPEQGTVDLVTGKGHLVINEDGSATWTPIDGLGVVTVSKQGSGAMVDRDGLVSVLDNGSTACASGKGLNLVNPDGSKAQATASGIIVLDKDGKGTRYAAPGSENKPAGAFNQCGPNNTVQVDLTADVLFEFDKSDLTPAGKQVVAAAAKIINENGKGKKVRIVGHTDSMGTPEDNMRLGQDRADSVEKELKALCPETEFETSSKGQSEPVAANKKADGSDNPDGRAKNRRVVVSWDK